MISNREIIPSTPQGSTIEAFSVIEVSGPTFNILTAAAAVKVLDHLTTVAGRRQVIDLPAKHFQQISGATI
jgi:hypothetical protein